MTEALGIDPALCAKSASSAMLSGKSSLPVSIPTNTARTSSTPVLCSWSFLIVCPKAHSSGGYYGGDGVLIDHLGHGVAQQNNVLIKRLNVTLQLNAIDQIDRHWNVLFAQGIQKRVLQQLDLFGIHTAP
jgi:hypothetical protein